MSEFLDTHGLSYFWNKFKSYVSSRFLSLAGGTVTGDVNLDGGEITYDTETSYPLFTRSSWSVSSDGSTLPVTPCFVLDTTANILYWCSVNSIIQINPIHMVSGNAVFDDSVLNITNGHIWVKGGSDAGGDINRLTTTDGTPGDMQYNQGRRGTQIYANGIAFADPYLGNSGNDAGWIRHIEETANVGTFEIAVGDDAVNEQIVVRRYNTSNAVANEIKLFDASANSSFPGTVTALKGFVANYNGTGSFNEGLRCNRSTGNGWTSITLGGANGTTSGIVDYAWCIGVPPTSEGRQLRICHNSSAAGTYFYTTANNNYVGLTVNGDIDIKRLDRDSSLATRSAVEYLTFGHKDKNNRYAGFMQTALNKDGSTQVTFGARCYNGGNKNNFFNIMVNRSGTATYSVTNAANFRSAIGAAASSDRRLKSDIEPLGKDAVEFIGALEPCVYTIHGERQVGLIAQDVHEADSWETRMAFETQEGIDGLDDWEKMEDGTPTWKLDYIRIIPPLVAALQSANKHIESLETKVESLETKVESLESEIVELKNLINYLGK